MVEKLSAAQSRRIDEFREKEDNKIEKQKNKKKSKSKLIS
jgi:hypothetical protein